MYLYNALFMYDFFHRLLPPTFDNVFKQISRMHAWLSDQTSVRTNYGKFSIRFCGVSLWNSIDEELKCVSKGLYKRKIINAGLIDKYSNI